MPHHSGIYHTEASDERFQWSLTLGDTKVPKIHPLNISLVATSLFPLLQPKEQFDHLTSPLSLHPLVLQLITLIKTKLSPATSEHILKFSSL